MEDVSSVKQMRANGVRRQWTDAQFARCVIRLWTVADDFLKLLDKDGILANYTTTS